MSYRQIRFQIRWHRGWLLSLFCLSALAVNSFAQTPTNGATPLDAATRTAVVEGVAQALDTSYVFPDKAKEMATALRERLARKDYDRLSNAETLAQTLTTQLQEISHDKHLRVLATTGEGARFAQRLDPAQNRLAGLKRNFGFEKLERLAGNVGYLDLRGFEDPASAGATLAAAMNFLANTEALIIDLRNNGGGSPEMVALFCSYFFAQPTHLNDIYDRPTNSTRAFWTQASVPGAPYSDKPLYVLTSSRTFSAGEEFPYNLKNLKRATIVGATTGGGAHPVRGERLPGGFIVTVPMARSINPISKTNWEGVGVVPDVAVSAEQALRAAHWLALKRLQPAQPEPLFAQALQTTLTNLHNEMDEPTRQAVNQAFAQAGAATSAHKPAAPTEAKTAPASAAPPKAASPDFTAPPLPDTPAGRSFGKFLTALNSGDLATMQRFHRETQGDEENAQQDLEMFQRTGGLKLHSLTHSAEHELTALVQSKQGDRWLNFSINVTPQAPHAITDIRIQPAAAPTASSSSASPAPARSAPEAAPKNPVNEAAALKEIETWLEEQSAADQFSGVVLIAKDGQPLWQRAYGLANRTHQVANRLDTKFNLGSINKTFTRLAIMQLVERGKLALSDTIGKHLPDYPNADAAAKVTVKHLLEMQSGIGDFFGPRFQATPKDRLRTLQDYLKLFADAPLAFEPGTSRNYSNGSYIVLGVLIEKVTGQSYYDYVRQNIFQPAGMNDTDAYEMDAAVPNLATGYLKAANGQRTSNVYTAPARGSSAGGGYSTAADLLKFTQALASGKLFTSAENKREFARGLGIAGGAPGLNAVLEWSPRQGYAVIVLSNYDPPSAETIGRQLRAKLSLP